MIVLHLIAKAHLTVKIRIWDKCEGAIVIVDDAAMIGLNRGNTQLIVIIHITGMCQQITLVNHHGMVFPARGQRHRCGYHRGIVAWDNTDAQILNCVQAIDVSHRNRDNDMLIDTGRQRPVLVSRIRRIKGVATVFAQCKAGNRSASTVDQALLISVIGINAREPTLKNRTILKECGMHCVAINIRGVVGATYRELYLLRSAIGAANGELILNLFTVFKMINGVITEIVEIVSARINLQSAA